jgi:hypothetical protein
MYDHGEVCQNRLGNVQSEGWFAQNRNLKKVLTKKVLMKTICCNVKVLDWFRKMIAPNADSLRCDFLVCLLPDLQINDGLYSYSEVKPESLILAREQVPEWKMKNLANPCSSFYPSFLFRTTTFFSSCLLQNKLQNKRNTASTSFSWCVVYQNLSPRGCASQEIVSKRDFPKLPRQNSVAPVLETQWHRFGQQWIFLGDFFWKSFFRLEKSRV